MQKVIKDFLHFYTNKSDKQEEMYNLPRLNHKKGGNLNRLITS